MYILYSYTVFAFDCVEIWSNTYLTNIRNSLLPKKLFALYIWCQGSGSRICLFFKLPKKQFECTKHINAVYHQIYSIYLLSRKQSIL